MRIEISYGQRFIAEVLQPLSAGASHYLAHIIIGIGTSIHKPAVNDTIDLIDRLGIGAVHDGIPGAVNKSLSGKKVIVVPIGS